MAVLHRFYSTCYLVADIVNDMVTDQTGSFGALFDTMIKVFWIELYCILFFALLENE